MAHNISGLDHLFSQVWPTDPDLPSATEAAMETLIPLANEIPIGYHFYTDGSKLPNGHVG